LRHENRHLLLHHASGFVGEELDKLDQQGFDEAVLYIYPAPKNNEIKHQPQPKAVILVL
jgi:hypothetical protein